MEDLLWKQKLVQPRDVQPQLTWPPTVSAAAACGHSLPSINMLATMGIQTIITMNSILLYLLFDLVTYPKGTWFCSKMLAMLCGASTAHLHDKCTTGNFLPPRCIWNIYLHKSWCDSEGLAYNRMAIQYYVRTANCLSPLSIQFTFSVLFGLRWQK